MLADKRVSTSEAQYALANGSYKNVGKDGFVKVIKKFKINNWN